MLSETHSYTVASEKLYISQPALTKNIKNLEQEFGGQLIVRSNKGCSLTDLGQILYRHAKKIEYEMKLLHTEIEKANTHTQNHLTVAFGILWQILYIAEIFLAVEERSKGNISITGKNGKTEDIDALLTGEWDLFLGKIPDELNAQLKAVPVMKTNHSIFAHASHPLFEKGGQGEEVSLEDLQPYKWLVFGSTDDISGYEIPNHFKQSIEIQTMHDINSLYTIISILQKSKSLILLPSQVGRHLEMHQIREITCHDLHFLPYDTGLIYRREMGTNTHLQTLIETIQQIVKASISQ
ncbi:MAG: LysR family transcriptional regulator [Sphaerochaeta sp.]|nr:LysR family transcriptional regulator [Sphaerochaeta sp.]